jgi:hypothetical protein
MSFIKHIFNRDSPEQITIKDIERVIEDKIEESLHLDYEEIPIGKVEYDGLSEHVSGFLNTSGGIVIFGVSERKEKGRNIPHKITWTATKKETVENNLYRKVDPWHDEIRIYPIQNPKDDDSRIFVIFVPKSKNPPHMANYRYFIRLNFQTRPIGHDQVSMMFKQYYLQKYDLINMVYSPIYSELALYYEEKRIREWRIQKYSQVKRERMFLLLQDWDLYEELEQFYKKVEEWNSAIKVAPFRLVKIINENAARFFNLNAFSHHNNVSAVSVEIKAESTTQIPTIDEAILNDKDPIEFWKENYLFDKISEMHFQIQYNTEANQVKTKKVPATEFKQFIEQLKIEVAKDELIKHVREEQDRLQSEIEILLDMLESRM